MPENDKLKFSQLAEITRAQMAGSDYAVGYKANGDNKKWTFENQADFLLNDSDAGQEFQETFVKVQDTEPSDENNKIWVKETPDTEVTVPTYDEFEDLRDSIAPTYSSSSTYAVGDYVMYGSQLYKCIIEIATPETWDTLHWESVSIAQIISRFIDSYAAFD